MRKHTSFFSTAADVYEKPGYLDLVILSMATTSLMPVFLMCKQHPMQQVFHFQNTILEKTNFKSDGKDSSTYDYLHLPVQMPMNVCVCMCTRESNPRLQMSALRFSPQKPKVQLLVGKNLKARNLSPVLGGTPAFPESTISPPTTVTLSQSCHCQTSMDGQ